MRFSSIKLEKIKKENLYIIIGGIMGLLMIFFLPPFQAPDEADHFYKAWLIASGYPMCTNHDQIPKSAFELPKKVGLIKIDGVKDKRVSYARIKSQLFAKFDDEKIATDGIICAAMPLGYAPQVLGLTTGKILHLSPLLGFYLARVFNLFLALFIVYWAIRILPFGKIIFFLIGLLPMTIQQFASLSYDALHISLIFLFIAYVLKLASERNKEITKKEIIPLLIISLFGFNVKMGYFGLAFLVFLLPKSKFENSKKYWLFSIGFLLANVATFLVLKTFFVDSATTVLREEINFGDQLKSVIGHPFGFLLIVIETVYNKFSFFLESFLGKPGWLKDSLSPFLYLFMLFGLIVLIKNEDEEVSMTKNQRWIMGGVFLLNILAVFLSMYLVWTKVGDDKVVGVQGRYFLSIFPLLVLAFYKSGFNFRFEAVRKNKNLFLALFLILVSIFTFLAYWNIYFSRTFNK